MHGTNFEYSVEKSVLKMCPVRICGTECLVLLDTRIVSNLIPRFLLSQMGIEPSQTRKKVTIANEVNAGCTGFMKDISVMFSEKDPN